VFFRWVSTIVALPILFYTSWELYERSKSFSFILIGELICGLMLIDGFAAYGSKVQKSLVDVNRKAVQEGSSKSS
jgi:hypothetical protein